MYRLFQRYIMYVSLLLYSNFFLFLCIWLLVLCIFSFLFIRSNESFECFSMHAYNWNRKKVYHYIVVENEADVELRKNMEKDLSLECEKEEEEELGKKAMLKYAFEWGIWNNVNGIGRKTLRLFVLMCIALVLSYTNPDFFFSFLLRSIRKTNILFMTTTTFAFFFWISCRFFLFTIFAAYFFSQYLPLYECFVCKHFFFCANVQCAPICPIEYIHIIAWSSYTILITPMLFSDSFALLLITY